MDRVRAKLKSKEWVNVILLEWGKDLHHNPWTPSPLVLASMLELVASCEFLSESLGIDKVVGLLSHWFLSRDLF